MEISTKEAARRLQVSPQRVLSLLHDQQLAGRLVGRTWLVDETSVATRALLGISAGRPWTGATVRRIVDALSNGARLSARDASLVKRTSAEELAAKIGQTIIVRPYSTKWKERAIDHLTLTGESATDRIAAGPGRRLHASAGGLHGYVRSEDAFHALMASARLVEDPTGDVLVYRIRDDVFPWSETPAALIAADCFRSTSTRVRSVGIDALQQMRTQWLTSTA